MWPALVLGILTAIFAWIWYRGGEEAKDPETKEQKQEELAVTPETDQEGVESEPGPLVAHLASRECNLPADDHDRFELNTNGQEVPCLRFQESKAVNPEAYQAKNEEKSELQGIDQEGLADVESGLKVQRPATTNVSSLTDQQFNAPAPGHLGNIQAHPLDVPKEESQKEHPSDSPKKEALQADIGATTTDVLKKETHGNIKENPTEVLRTEKLEVDIQEHYTEVLRTEKLQVDIQEHYTEVLRTEKLQVDIQECPTDVQKKAVLPADIEEHHTDVPEKEELQTDTQECPSYVPKSDEQAIVLEHQAVFSVKGDNLLEGHVEDIVKTCADESCIDISSKNDEIHSQEVEVHPPEIPEAKQILINKEEYNPLIKEMQLSVGNLDKEVEEATRDFIRPTLIAEEPGTQRLPADSCHESMSVPRKEFLQPENESQDGICATSERNGENQTAIDATGCPWEHEFVVKENALNLCQAKDTLNKDLYLEMGNTSNDAGNANTADQFMKQSVEKSEMRICSDIIKPSSGFLDDADLHAGSLKESSQEASTKVQKLETRPDISSVDIYNLGFNLEKEMAGLSSSNTDDKTTFGSPSDANIHDNDHQKTRKVATIQPMPQNVNFVFKVHYITHNDSEIIAITGDHEKLGKWQTYVPLTSGNGGFWSCTINLPADTILAWKFVMVENGKIKRWEECNNRFLKTAHEDIEAQLWWGYP